jgi:membrane protein
MGYWVSLFKETYTEWARHEAPRLGAAIAYYTVLAIAPLLIVVISVAGLVFGREAAQGQILLQVRDLVGTTGAEAIETTVVNFSQPAESIIATLIGLATLFIATSGVFVELRASLNRIWDIPPKPEEGFLTTIRERFLSFGMVVAIGFILLVSLVVSAGIAAARTFMEGYLPMPGWLMQGLNFTISLAVFTGVFALIYRMLPDEPISWRETLIGAAFTALLFATGKFLIGIYLGQASTTSAYGAAGSIIVVLIWVYYSAQIFFFGAEFTRVYALHTGKVQANPVGSNAVMSVPVHITGNADSEAQEIQQEAAAGGAAMSGQSSNRAHPLLVGAVGALLWWRGKKPKRQA